MTGNRFTVMGAGEVGYLLAQMLSREGHDVTVIDIDDEKRARIEDLTFVTGSGTHAEVLERSNTEGCDLFIAASSSEEANLSAGLLAKELGATRSCVRLSTIEDLTVYRRLYEQLFRVDLLLSPQILATNVVMNHVLGHNTWDVEHLARGQIQLRRIHVQESSPLVGTALKDVRMPRQTRIVGFIDADDHLQPVGPESMAKARTEALVVCATHSIRAVEELFAAKLAKPKTAVVAGGSATGLTVARNLASQVGHVKLIERDRRRGQAPGLQVPSDRGHPRRRYGSCAPAL